MTVVVDSDEALRRRKLLTWQSDLNHISGSIVLAYKSRTVKRSELTGWAETLSRTAQEMKEAGS